MKYSAVAILLCLAVGCVYGNDPCENVSCHFGLGFVMQRMSTIQVCGSDGQTYDFCDFKKAICRDHTLTLTKIGAC